MPTLRFLGLMLVAVPVLILAGGSGGLAPVAGLYVLLVVGLAAGDYFLADRPEAFVVRREHEDRLSLAVDNHIRLTVSTRGRRPTTVWLRDEPPPAFFSQDRVFSGALWPREVAAFEYLVRPPRRGNYGFGALNLRWLGPLGLVVRQHRYPANAPVKVYPNLIDVRKYDLLVRRSRLQELGLRQTRALGRGTEFERLREYQQDDDFRRINWKATARRGRPIAIEFETERSQAITAVVDIGRMMQSPVGDVAKLDFVLNAVLLLAYVATARGDRVGLMTFADDIEQYLAPRQGRAQFYRMLETLYAVEAQPVEPDFGRALSYLGVKARKRSLIVIFTDLTGGISTQALISYLAPLTAHHLPVVVTISDPEVVRASTQEPRDSASTFERAMAGRLLEDRALLLQRLEHSGILTLDVPAERLTVAVINKYLELKERLAL